MARAVLAVAIFAIEFFLLAAPDRNPGNSFAFACDPFGYLRQARLFQEKGLLGGLHTAIDRPDARYMVETAKSLGKPDATWAAGLGPHCHHYDGGSGQVILQYPPGTGFLLSLFPPGTGGQHTFTVAVGLVAMTALAACLLFQPNLLVMLLLGAIVAGVTEMLRVPMSFASYSIPWSVAIIPVCALGALRLFDVTGARQVLLGAALGLGCGLLVLIRLPNVFVVAGLALFLLLEGGLWARRAWVDNAGALFAGTIAFLLAGPGIVALFNRINTGSALRTTYGAEDAAGVSLSWDVIRHNLDYYFRCSDDVAFVDGSLALLAVSLVGVAFNRQLRSAFLAAAIATTLAVAFFVTHKITAPYYLVPSSTLVVFLVGLAWSRTTKPSGRTSMNVMILLAFAGLVGIRMKASNATPFPMTVPQEVVAADAIVWSDIMSGSLLFYNDKFAAKIPFIHPCVRTSLVQAFFDAGRPQYFVVDSDLMRGNVDEVAASVEQIGIYQAQEKFPILRLTGVKKPPDFCPR